MQLKDQTDAPTSPSTIK